MSNSTLRTLDHFFYRCLSFFFFFLTPHKIQPSPALLLNTRRPHQLAHRRRRRPRTSLSTEPGSRPVAWLSQRQHRSLKCTCVTPERSLIDLGRSTLEDISKFFPSPIHLCVKERLVYRRMRWWPDDFFQVEEPTCSRSRGRLGRSPPGCTQCRSA